MPEDVQIVSQTLQTQWSAFCSSPGTSAIFWPTSKPDMSKLDQVSQQTIIGCYNPASPASVDDNAQGLWTITEDIVVDIIIKIAPGTQQQALDLRETLKKACYDILHHNEGLMAGISEAHLTRESYKVESPEHVREALMLKCKSFHTKT